MEKYINVKVKDLIKYLEKFDPEATVGLDKDGWYVNPVETDDVLELIDKRGLFHYWKNRNHLTINN